MKRREFVKKSMIATGGIGMVANGAGFMASCSQPELFKISLAQWWGV